MAGTQWPTADSLRTALLRRGWEFEFEQAVALLERFFGGASRPGYDGPYSAERLRFGPVSRLVPSATQIRRISRLAAGAGEGDADEIRVSTAILGLYGMSAPGPPYMFEAAAREGATSRQHPLCDFLDLFNNRMIALYYRAGRKYRWPLEFSLPGHDSTSRRMFALIGLGAPTQRAVGGGPRLLADHDSLTAITPRSRLLRYLGCFTQRVRCPANLRGLLWDYFKGPDHRFDEFVEIEEYVPHWITIEEGRRTFVGTRNYRLGGRAEADDDDDIVVGKRIRDRLGQFRVVLGPLKQGMFRDFLPIGPAYAALIALVDLYRPDRLSYRIRLRVRAAEVPCLVLGRKVRERLGWSTWLQSGQRERRVEGTVNLRRREPSEIHASMRLAATP